MKASALMLGLVASLAQATISQEFNVESKKDEWTGKETRWAKAFITATSTTEDGVMLMAVLKTAGQAGGSQGCAWITLLCRQLPSRSGKVSLKVTYSDSSSKVITQTKNTKDELTDITVGFQQVDPEGRGYQFMGAYFFRADDQILSDAVKLIAKVAWDKPYLTEMAFAGSGYFVFGTKDLREVRKVLNYEFSKE
jgi:hypothetical protein